MDKPTLPIEYPAKGRFNKCSFLDLLTSFEVTSTRGILPCYIHVIKDRPIVEDRALGLGIAVLVLNSNNQH